MIEEELIQEAQKLIQRFERIKIVGEGWSGNVREGWNFHRSLGGGITIAGTSFPTGACCIESGCSIQTESSCGLLGGLYLGDGTGCVPNPCIPPPPCNGCGFDAFDGSGRKFFVRERFSSGTKTVESTPEDAVSEHSSYKVEFYTDNGDGTCSGPFCLCSGTAHYHATATDCDGYADSCSGATCSSFENTASGCRFVNAGEFCIYSTCLLGSGADASVFTVVNSATSRTTTYFGGLFQNTYDGTVDEILSGECTP